MGFFWKKYINFFQGGFFLFFQAWAGNFPRLLHFPLMIELLLIVLFDFKMEAALEDLIFGWLVCLTHIRYYDISMKNYNKFDWPGSACGLVYPILEVYG